MADAQGTSNMDKVLQPVAVLHLWSERGRDEQRQREEQRIEGDVN